jgi:hypothetical protein
MMRLIMIAAVSLLALAPGALAETAEPEPAPARPTAAQTTGLTQNDIAGQHPDWFTEEGIPYRPCPCSVVFPDGRHACLGLP